MTSYKKPIALRLLCTAEAGELGHCCRYPFRAIASGKAWNDSLETADPRLPGSTPNRVGICRHQCFPQYMSPLLGPARGPVYLSAVERDVKQCPCVVPGQAGGEGRPGPSSNGRHRSRNSPLLPSLASAVAVAVRLLWSLGGVEQIPSSAHILPVPAYLLAGL